MSLLTKKPWAGPVQASQRHGRGINALPPGRFFHNPLSVHKNRQ
jgi:hypothetical protein